MQTLQKEAPSTTTTKRAPGRYTHRLEGHIHARDAEPAHFVAMKAGEFGPQDLAWILRNCALKSDYLITKL